MLAMFHDSESPAVIVDDHIIGTAMAVGLALASAGATAATNIYATKKAGDVNTRSIDTQYASEQAARAAEQKQHDEDLAAQAARDEANRKAETAAREQYYQFEQQKWNDYVQAHQPYWGTAQNVYGSLLDMLGLPKGSMGTGFQTPTMPIAPPGAAGAGTGAASSPAPGPAGSPAPTAAVSSLAAGVRPYTRMAGPVSKAPMSLADLLAMAQAQGGATTPLNVAPQP